MSTGTQTYANHYRDRTVLVTGGAGFIGSHLVHRLLALGANVRVIDDLSTGHPRNLNPRNLNLQNLNPRNLDPRNLNPRNLNPRNLNPRNLNLQNLNPRNLDPRNLDPRNLPPAPEMGEAHFTEASILDDHALRDAAEGCTIIFHLAAMVSVPQSVAEPVRCMQINGEGTQRVLDIAREVGARRVVFASSSALYGDAPNLPSRENDPIVCCSPYAASKAAGEAMVSAFGHCYDLSTISLRYFNIFGPRQDPNSPYAAAIAAFTDALRAGRRATIFGDGLQTRDFTFIDNVTHANLLAGRADDDLTGAVINIGTGARVSLLETLQALGIAMNVDATYDLHPPRPGDVRDSSADITRARELLGYEPVVSFKDGIVRTVE